MNSLDSIKQSSFYVEYDYTTPKSYIVLIPIVSLVFRYFASSQLLKALNVKANSEHLDLFQAQETAESKKLTTLYKWHFMGSLAQTIGLIGLQTLLPLSSPLILFSLYGAISSFQSMHSFSYISRSNQISISR